MNSLTILLIAVLLTIVTIDASFGQDRHIRSVINKNIFLSTGLLLKGAEYQEGEKLYFGAGFRKIKSKSSDKYQMSVSRFIDVGRTFERRSWDFSLKYAKGFRFFDFVSLEPFAKALYTTRDDILYINGNLGITTDRNSQAISLGADLELFGVIKNKLSFSAGIEAPLFTARRYYFEHTSYGPPLLPSDPEHYETLLLGEEFILFVTIGLLFN